MNIVFMGTPDFAIPCLNKLVEFKYSISCVFSQPDRPKGRGNTLASPPVKLAAEQAGIPVVQPLSLKDECVFDYLKSLQPDCIVVVAYGKILPPEILSIPKFGCVNIHASLLPLYRGAAPIQWAIMRGETVTGITSMLMDKGLDTGDMLIRRETDIGHTETAGELFRRLSEIGAEVLVETLTGLANKTLIPLKQDESRATYAPPISKQQCLIDWSLPATQIHNLIRGIAPFLSAYTQLNAKRLKILSAYPAKNMPNAPGRVIQSDSRLIVACGEQTALELLTVQAEGKSPLPVTDFLRGYPLPVGTQFL